MISLLFGQDQVVAQWAADKYKAGLAPCWYAVGIVRDERIVGAATFHDYNGSNVELCYWGPQSLRLKVVQGLMAFAFDHLKVNRVTARTPRWNKRVTRKLPKLGFQYEGTAHCYYGPKRRDDAVLFGLLPERATRFLRRAA